MPKNPKIEITLSAAEIAALDLAADSAGLSRSAAGRVAIKRWIKEMGIQIEAEDPKR